MSPVQLKPQSSLSQALFLMNSNKDMDPDQVFLLSNHSMQNNGSVLYCPESDRHESPRCCFQAVLTPQEVTQCHQALVFPLRGWELLMGMLI